jgi:hypothetical protein
MEEYAIPETALAQESDARADDKFQEALRNNQRSDNYTVLLIGFATVLFFGALAGRLKTPRAQWFMLAAGGVGFVICTAVLISFPKLV